MNLQDLINLYRGQIQELQKLSNLADEKQKALIQNEHEVFDTILLQEQRLIGAIKSVEIRRLDIITGFIKRFYPQDMNKKPRKLSILLAGAVSQQELDILTDLEEQTRTLVLTLQEKNFRNMQLLQHMRRFYAETISSVLSLAKKQSFVDRKV